MKNSGTGDGIQTTGITVNGHNTVIVGENASIVVTGSSANAVDFFIGSNNALYNYGKLISVGTTFDGTSSIDMVYNYGVIVSSYGLAISLGAGDDLLTLGTGSSITGSIEGGTGTNDLTLVGSGSEDSDISNFESLTMNGTNWTLSGQTSFTNVVVNSGSLTLTRGLALASPGTLENRGALVAYITGSSGADTISNYGTITGSISLSDGDDALTLGTGSDITGSMDGGSGSDDVTLVGSGTEDGDFTNFELLTMAGAEWELSGTSSFNNIAVESGILRLNGVVTGNVQVAAGGTLGGTGTIYGDVTSFGTLSAGNSVGTATIVGNLVQNGGSFIEFDAGGVDRWDVTGTATLVDNPTLTISSLDGSSTAYGVILHADGGITGSFALPLIYDGNGAVSIEQTNEDIILTVVDGTSVVADHYASLQTGMSFFDHLGINHAWRPGSRGPFWLEGFGQSGNEEAQDGNDAYEYSFGGTAAGWEAKAAKGISLGVSLGLSSSEVEVSDSASASSSRNVMGALSASFEQAGAFLNTAFGAGTQSLDSLHTAAVGTERLSVETDTNAWLMGAALQAGVEMNVAGGWSIVPSVSLAYLHQWVEGYEEQIGSASAVIDTHDAGLLRLRGNLELRHFGRQDGIVYTPNLKLGVVDDIASGGVATGAFSSGTPFELSLSSTDKLRALGGIGLEAQFANGSNARLAYEGEASTSSLAHALTLEVKLYW